jgi:hypothetical protein
MKLGLSIGYSGAHLDLPVARVQLAERLRPLQRLVARWWPPSSARPPISRSCKV